LEGAKLKIKYLIKNFFKQKGILNVSSMILAKEPYPAILCNDECTEMQLFKAFMNCLIAFERYGYCSIECCSPNLKGQCSHFKTFCIAKIFLAK